MAGWKRVLCAVDFSPCSRDAAETAARLVADRGGTLTLLHVYSPALPTIASDVVSYTPTDLEGEALHVAERDMAALKRDVDRLAGEAEVVARVVPGDPTEAILRALREGDHDLLVVGTHGRKGLKRVLLGSVAEHLVRAAAVPVLVARAERCFDLARDD
jgi:nucleotide-binding universal stress UspA family protein